MNLTEARQHLERLAQQSVAVDTVLSIVKAAEVAEARVRELERTRSRLSSEVNALDVRVREWAEKLEKQQREFEVANKAQEAKSRDKAAVINAEIRALGDRLDAGTAEIEAQLAERRKAADGEINTLQKRIAELSSQEQKITRTLRRLRSQVGEVEP